MRALLLLLALAASAAWAERPEPSWLKQPAQTKADPGQGRLVALGGQFGQSKYACTTCHGQDGSGDRSGAIPRIAGQSEWYLLQSLEQYASGARHSDIMGPVAAQLTRHDMRDVAAYYAGLSTGFYPSKVVPVGHDVYEQGQSLARRGEPKSGVLACSGCHGEHGAGNGPLFPYLLGQYQPYLRLQLERFKSGERGGAEAQVMTQIARGLTEKQIEAASQYYASLRPSEIAGMKAVNANQGGSAQPREARPPSRPAKPHMGAALSPK